MSDVGACLALHRPFITLFPAQSLRHVLVVGGVYTRSARHRLWTPSASLGKAALAAPVVCCWPALPLYYVHLTVCSLSVQLQTSQANHTHTHSHRVP